MTETPNHMALAHSNDWIRFSFFAWASVVTFIVLFGAFVVACNALTDDADDESVFGESTGHWHGDDDAECLERGHEVRWVDREGCEQVLYANQQQSEAA